MTITTDPPADIISQWLADAGHGFKPESKPKEWPVFVGRSPDGSDVVDDIITVYDTTGKQDGRIMKTGENINHPGLQIAVRSMFYTSGHNKLTGIAKGFDSIKNVDVSVGTNNYTILSVSRGTIIPVGQETSGRTRFLFTLNVFATFKEIP